jgi:membrane protease YdiL (CAAX protease family)
MSVVDGMSWLRTHQVAAFVALTFAISWTIWLAMAAGRLSIATPTGAVLNVIGMAGPSIASLILAAVLGGPVLRRLLDGFSLSLVSARWTVVAVALPLLMVAVAIAISVAVLGGRVPVVTAGVIGALVGEWVRILFLGGPLEEELGWRGFALPRLQLRHTALRAAVLLGLVWGLWHIPLYFVPGTGQYETVAGASSPGFAIGAFVVWTVGLSILFTWLFNETRGSLIVVMLFHASVNLGSYVPAAVGSTGGSSFLYAIVTWIVALAVVWRFGGRTLAGSSEVVTAES